MNIVLTGACLSGNMGGQALYLSAVSLLRKKYGFVRFFVMSKTFQDDLAANHEPDITVVPFSTLTQLLLGVPLFFVAGILHLLHIPNKWCSIGPFKKYAQAEMVVDCSGIAYTDDRGFLDLLINTLWFLAAFVYRIPVYKMAQQLGPFKRFWVRMAAKWVLPKMAAVVCRGETSYTYTKELLPNYSALYNFPDIAFTLPQDENEAAVNELLEKSGILANKTYMVLSPSTVVQNKLGTEPYSQIFCEIAKTLSESGRGQLLFLPHTRAHSKQFMVDSKSDDIQICRHIQRQLQQQGIASGLVEEDCSAGTLKAIVAGAELVFCSRYHCMIAALSSAVPTLVIGWSHKYQESMALFGMQEYSLGCQSVTTQQLHMKLEDLNHNRRQIKRNVLGLLPQIHKDAEQNIEIIEKSKMKG